MAKNQPMSDNDADDMPMPGAKAPAFGKGKPPKAAPKGKPMKKAFGRGK